MGWENWSLDNIVKWSKRSGVILLPGKNPPRIDTEATMQLYYEAIKRTPQNIQEAVLRCICKLDHYALTVGQPRIDRETLDKIHVLIITQFPHLEDADWISLYSSLLVEDDEQVKTCVNNLKNLRKIEEGEWEIWAGIKKHTSLIRDYLLKKASLDQRETFETLFDFIQVCPGLSKYAILQWMDLEMSDYMECVIYSHKYYSKTILKNNPFEDDIDEWPQLAPHQNRIFITNCKIKEFYIRHEGRVLKFVGPVKSRFSEKEIEETIEEILQDPFLKKECSQSSVLGQYQLRPTIDQMSWLLEERIDLLRVCEYSQRTECKIHIALKRNPLSQKDVDKLFKNMTRKITAYPYKYVIVNQPRTYIPGLSVLFALFEHINLMQPSMAKNALFWAQDNARTSIVYTILCLHPSIIDDIELFLAGRISNGQITISKLVLAHAIDISKKMMQELSRFLTPKEQKKLPSSSDKNWGSYICPGGGPLFTLLDFTYGYPITETSLLQNRHHSKIHDLGEFLRAYRFKMHDPSLAIRPVITSAMLIEAHFSKVQECLVPSNRKRVLVKRMWKHFEIFIRKEELLDVISFYTYASPEIALVLIKSTLGSVPDLVKSISDYGDSNPFLYALRCGFIHAAKTFASMGFSIDKTMKEQRRRKITPLVELITVIKKIDSLEVTISSEKHDDVMDFCDMLLDQGYDPNGSLPTNHQGESSCSLLEHCFLTHTSNRSLLLLLMERLIKKGAQITPRVAREMKWEMMATHKLEYLKPLIEQGFITKDESEIIVNGTDENKSSGQSLAEELLRGKLWLEKELTRNNLNPLYISYREIARLRELKKRAKAEMQQDTTSVLTGIYHSFVEQYDRLVNKHLVLKELREISKEIRSKPKELSDRLITFYSLWSHEECYGQHVVQRINKIFGETRKYIWNAIYSRIIDAGALAQYKPSVARQHIVWFHGTKSASLPSIVSSQALIPAGELLKEGIVPFNGELSGSDLKENANGLSGEAFSRHWNDGSGIFQSRTKLQISLLYAQKNDGYCVNEKSFDPAASWSRVTPQFLDELRALDHGVNNWEVLAVDIMRLRLTDPEADTKLSTFREYVTKLAAENPGETCLANLLNYFELKFKYKLTSNDLQMIAHPYPIIFASTTTDTREGDSQYYVKDRHWLGRDEDIQLAFTDAEHVEEVQERLNAFGIEVFPIDVLRYLETVHMIKGAENIAMKEKGMSTREQIARYLQRDILPLYSWPLPENPSYFDENTKTWETIENPLYHAWNAPYEEYIERVENLDILPRNIHGPMHAARTALWSQVLYALLKLNETEIDPLWLALTAGAHDSAREDEGVDRWDPASSRFLKGYLQTMGFYVKETVAKYAHAIAEKDPPNDNYTSDIQRIVHDSDCLEILRVILLEQFMEEKLCFFALSSISDEMKSKLLDEFYRFIMLTEKPAYKQRMERESDNFFMDLIKLVEAEQAQFPTLWELIA